MSRTQELDGIIDGVLYPWQIRREGKDLYIKVAGEWVPAVDWKDGDKLLRPEQIRRIARRCYKAGMENGGKCKKG